MKTQTNLPNGWKEVELGKILKLKGGFAFKSETFSETGIPVVRISNFNNNEVDLSEAVCYPEKEAKKYEEFLLKENDILIAMSGATTGKIGVVKKEILPCLLNQRVGKFEITDEKVYWKYLLFFVKSPEFLKSILSRAGGCAQPNISGKQIEKISFLLPPLTVQKKIVSILEKAEKLKQKREEADKLTNEYLKSVFNDMFYNKEFEEVELGNKKVFEVQSGGTPSKTKKEYWENGNIPWVGSTVCKDLPIYKSEQFITKEGLDNSSAKIFPKNTVLIALVGATIGKTGILMFNCSTNQNISGIIIQDKKKIDPNYLFFATKQLYPKFMFLCGDTFKMATLSFIRSLKIPLPPLPLQQKFAKIVEKVEKLKERQKDSKEKINEMFDALMQKAFRGELI